LESIFHKEWVAEGKENLGLGFKSFSKEVIFGKFFTDSLVGFMEGEKDRVERLHDVLSEEIFVWE